MQKKFIASLPESERERMKTWKVENSFLLPRFFVVKNRTRSWNETHKWSTAAQRACSTASKVKLEIIIICINDNSTEHENESVIRVLEQAKGAHLSYLEW